MDALLDSLRHAKKPGQQSSVEMEEEDRLNFGAALIRALEDAERSAAAPRSGEALAGAAYEKLQFDFPVRGWAGVDGWGSGGWGGGGWAPAALLTAQLLPAGVAARSTLVVFALASHCCRHLPPLPTPRSCWRRRSWRRWWGGSGPGPPAATR